MHSSHFQKRVLERRLKGELSEESHTRPDALEYCTQLVNNIKHEEFAWSNDIQLNLRWKITICESKLALVALIQQQN